MIVRGSKHVLRGITTGLRTVELSEAISHFFNCLLGSSLNASPAPVNSVGSNAEWTKLTPASLREQVASEVRKRFRYALPEHALDRDLHRPQLLRELCLAAGIQLDMRQYAFDDPQPETNGVHSDDGVATKGKNKSKASSSASPVERSTTFVPDDVMNVYPVAKKVSFRVGPCLGPLFHFI